MQEVDNAIRAWQQGNRTPELALIVRSVILKKNMSLGVTQFSNEITTLQERKNLHQQMK